ncbi:MAG TPA: sulfite exporter TauE/SafE family protein [Victivallales bacterium]|nr:sulfite exporter TauE/SafE family protein [Victivallales bacterium]
MLIFIFFLASAIAGIITGLLGGGIGFVIIPLLVLVFKIEHVSNSLIMHCAIGTTSMSIAIMGTVGSISHYKKNSVVWSKVIKVLYGLLIGVIIGALVANQISSSYLILAFGIIVLILAVYVWFGCNDKSVNKKVPTTNKKFHIGGALIGLVGGIFGINPISVPFFKNIGMDMRSAIGTSLVVGTIMAFCIALMYTITGFGVIGLPRLSTGYIDWFLVIPISIAGSLFAPLGAKLAHSIPHSVLKVLYGILLVVVGINMIVSVI